LCDSKIEDWAPVTPRELVLLEVWLARWLYSSLIY
jgi:hypothetical protein